MLQKRKILLLGGTGAMGVYLAPKLVDMGYQVFVTSRKDRVAKIKNLHYIQGNAHDLEFVQNVLKGHYDAIVDFMVYTTEEFSRRYECLLEATEHYLFLSSYRVYANNEGVPIKEDFPLSTTNPYGATKHMIERILTDLYVSDNEWNITILRLK